MVKPPTITHNRNIIILNFKMYQPLLQSSVSNDPSEIILKKSYANWVLKKHLLSSSCAACGNIPDSLMNRKKKQHLFVIDLFGNIINVLTITFDKFNVSLLNKIYNFFQNNLIIITFFSYY